MRAGNDEETEKLLRYLLGLSLVAATAPMDGFLRQGCLLVPASEVSAQWQVVGRNGKRSGIELTHEVARDYAAAKATDFVVGDSRLGEKAVRFSKDLAKADAATGDRKATAGGKAGKGSKGKKAEVNDGVSEDTTEEA